MTLILTLGHTFRTLVAATAFFAASLMAVAVHAQTAAPEAPAPPQVQATPATGTTAPRYAAADIERAFSFMDASKDGKVSREEAAGFRNVAKHFNAADTNQDQALSLEEFASAVNRPKTP
jgi:negative regulator of sigma E activity